MNAAADGQASGTGKHKPHFVVLDGLRGVAALCVVVFHFSEMIFDYTRLWIGHGFLAVDFFFCLSGFVLGYAYDDRVAGMGLGRFLMTRLIRLHPMVVFGSVLGLIALYANPLRAASGYGFGRTAPIFAASILLIPYGTMQERGLNLFGLNAPSWSLFWEYATNLIFGLALYRIRVGALITLTAVSAILLCLTAHHAGNLSGGWNAGNFAEGGARAVFSFCAGLLVYRMGWRVRTPLGFIGLSLLLVLAFVMPFALRAWVREAAVILVYFPLLVALGAGAVATPEMERLCRFSGDLSYPLYMTHYAVIWIWGDFAYSHKLASRGIGLPVLIGTLSMVACSWAVSKFFDEPVRRYLRGKFIAA